MSKTRIMEEAQREKYIRSDLEYYHFLKELENLENEMEKLSGEEKEKWKEKYNAKIEERLRSLREEIETMERRYNGTPWNLFNNNNSFCCAIVRKSDKELIGYVAVKDSRSDLWEISMELFKKHCHKGYGKKAMNLFLPAISQITGKDEFQALVETDNIPSQRLVEKLGARLIGIYDYMFQGNVDEAEAFEERYLDRITDRMIELAGQLEVEPRKMLSHVLDYRFFIENSYWSKR